AAPCNPRVPRYPPRLSLPLRTHFRERSTVAKKYRIAWMPGDGVGNDVMQAARIVLEAMDFDAEYIPADIGWEFWCKEGDPLPQRTIDILKNTDCALFGAITSKPRDEANDELDPSLKGK